MIIILIIIKWTQLNSCLYRERTAPRTATDTSTAAESASTVRRGRSPVSAWCPSLSGEPGLVNPAAKLVNVMVAPSRTTSNEVKTPSIALTGPTEKRTIAIAMRLSCVVRSVKLLNPIRDVSVNCLKIGAEINYIRKVASFVVVMVVIHGKRNPGHPQLLPGTNQSKVTTWVRLITSCSRAWITSIVLCLGASFR